MNWYGFFAQNLLSKQKTILYQTISFQGSRDNMSIIIIAFPAAPKATSEAIKAENELNDLLKQKVTGNGKRDNLIGENVDRI